MKELTREMLRELAAPLPPELVEFLPRNVANNRALALPYADARAVMARLDAVVGADWSFEWEPVSDNGKMVKGRLTICGITRCDAGESDREDEVLKSAVSDALKRCSVHFGVARYLYHLPQVWAGYDTQKKRWSENPQISGAAIQRAVSLALGEAYTSQPAAEQPRSHPKAEAKPAPESNGAAPNGASPTPGLELDDQVAILRKEIQDGYKASDLPKGAADFWDWMSRAGGTQGTQWSQFTPRELEQARDALRVYLKAKNQVVGNAYQQGA